MDTLFLAQEVEVVDGQDIRRFPRGWEIAGILVDGEPEIVGRAEEGKMPAPGRDYLVLNFVAEFPVKCCRNQEAELHIRKVHPAELFCQVQCNLSKSVVGIFQAVEVHQDSKFLFLLHTFTGLRQAPGRL